MIWRSYEDNREVEIYESGRTPSLAMIYDLATTGKNLSAAIEADKGTTKVSFRASGVYSNFQKA